MISLKRDRDYILLFFDYNPDLIQEVKTIPGRKWQPETKSWRVPVESWPALIKVIEHYPYQYIPSRETFIKPHLFISDAFRNNLRLLSVSRRVQHEFEDKLNFIDKFGLLTDKSHGAFERLLREDIFISSVKDIQDFLTIHWKVSHETLKVKGFKGELYPFQHIGANSLIAFRNFLLFDAMGLGKCVQSIFAVLRMHEKGRVSKVLVICPSPLKYQWAKEIQKFSDASFCVIEGAFKKRDKLWHNNVLFTVVNYELMRIDIDIIKKLHFDLVIADEVQRIKSFRAKTTKALKSINCFYKFALTGTPVENHLGELFSICEWVNPDILGWWKTFDDRYCERDRFGQVTSYKNLDEIHAKIKGLMIRRTADEVIAQLPEVVENTYLCELCGLTKELYSEMKEDIRVLTQISGRLERDRFAIETVESKLKIEKEAGKNVGFNLKKLQENKVALAKKIGEKRGKILALFTFLLEVCDSPELLKFSDSEITKKYCKEFDLKKTKSYKVEELVNILTDLKSSSEKTVVFTKYERMIRILEPALKKAGIRFTKVFGSLSEKEKDERLDLFKKSKNVDVLITTDCLAYGKNIQEARHLINFDLPFNPARLLQRNARIRRLDSKHKSIHIIYLISNTEAERNILDILFSKMSLALNITNPREFEIGNLEKLGVKGVAKLLGLDKQSERRSYVKKGRSEVRMSEDNRKNEGRKQGVAS